MVFVNSIKQKVLSTVEDTTGDKNVAKYVTSLWYMMEFGVLVAVTNFDLNLAIKNSKNN